MEIEANNMKKIKVNGTDVPTPIALKWEAENGTKSDIIDKVCSEEKKQLTEESSITTKSGEIEIVPSIQPHFFSKEGDKLKENYDIKEIVYEKIYPNSHPISKNKNKSPQLPLRLFNIKKYNDENEEDKNDKIISIKELKKYVEEVQERTDIKNYATLSYVWGKVENEDELTSLGRKSLTKAIEACNNSRLNICYLWIDQLCINQKDREEKAEEVKKMRKCYGDSTVTLVAIHTNLADKKNNLEKILKTILRSKWFSRSWTFQEGWLSKQTIFMFDDYLIDGREVAKFWITSQPIITEYTRTEDIKKIDQGVKKIATPLGWSYYDGEYNPEDTVTLTLSQALREISNRGRGIPVDGVYSILGLLPYGDKVKVEYKEKVQDGDHPIYFKEDVEKALLEVMKEAVKAGYGEPLAWFGPSYESPRRCWLPTVSNFADQTAEREKRQKNGSTSVEGGIDIRYKGDKSVEEIFTKDNNIKVNCSEYIIENIISSSISTEEGGFLIKTGATRGDINIEAKNHPRITVRGTKESLDKIKENHLLLIPNKNEWESNKPFAILAEKKRKSHICHRIGLVEIIEGAEKLEDKEQEEIIIGGYAENNAQLIEQISPYYQTQIQIPPK